MRRALQQTGWSLVTLGALGLSSRAFGQTATPAQEVRTPVVQAAGTRAEPTKRNELVLLEEMRVELAWLGDPFTFSYGLLAHCDGKVLQVHGTIPDERVRQRALQLARAQTQLPLVDALRTHPYHLARRTATEAPRDLEESARRLLLENCGPAAESVEVHADADGTVLVRGVIPSYEARLAVSRTLHQLGGCTCAVNQLTVRSVERDGLIYSQILADADHLVALATASRTSTNLPAPAADDADFRRPEPPERQVAATVAAAPTSPAPLRLEPVPVTASQVALADETLVSAHEPAPAALGQPYVVLGIVTFPHGDPAPPMLPAAATIFPGPTAAVSCILLQQRVASVCGSAARDVHVLADGGDRLTIHLTLTDSAAGERLSRQVLAMPELGPFRVFLQVHSRQ